MPINLVRDTTSIRQQVEECFGGHGSESGVHGLEDGIHVKLFISHQGVVVKECWQWHKRHPLAHVRFARH